MASKSAKSMKGWFKRCVARVKRDASVVDPSAVCGAALRKKREAGYVPARSRTARADGSKRRQPASYSTRQEKKEQVRTDRRSARASRTRRRTDRKRATRRSR